MSGRNLFYVLIGVLVFFLVVDFISIFFVRRNFDVAYYNTEISVEYGGSVTIKTVSGLTFSDQSKKERYVEAYKENTRETFEKYFSQISKDIGKVVKVVGVSSNVEDRGDVLEITETVTLDGLVAVEDGTYRLGMGRVKLTNVGNSSLSVRLPPGAIVGTVEPTPTKVLQNVILWTKGDIRYFPEVVFRRGE